MKLVIASEGMGIWCKDFLTHIVKTTLGAETIFEKSSRSKIIIRSIFFHIEPEISNRLPYITWSGEPFEMHEKDYPPLFSIWNKNSFQIPFIVIAFFELQDIYKIQYNLQDLRVNKNTFRPYFLAYCARAKYQHREEMFTLLKQRDKTNTCHGIGECQASFNKPIDGSWHVIWKEYTNYRFVLAMENHKIDKYVTEKLLNVLISGAIPIYYGDSTWVKQVFNEKCIIFTDDFDTFEDCANYVVQVDTAPELYNKYINEPRFVKDVGYFTNCADYEKMGNLLKQFVS